MQTIRSAARALIIHDRRVLFVEMRNDAGAFYILPGGGQVHGEPLSETVKRECAEELGVAVSVGSLCYTREYIGKHHNFDSRHAHFHQIEHVFFCDLEQEQSLGKGHSLDKKAGRLSMDCYRCLGRVPSLAKTLVGLLQSETLNLENPYLGDVN